MRLLRGLTKAAVLKKVVDEARKPQNQVKMKQLVSKMTRRGGGARPGEPR